MLAKLVGWDGTSLGWVWEDKCGGNDRGRESQSARGFRVREGGHGEGGEAATLPRAQDGETENGWNE